MNTHAFGTRRYSGGALIFKILNKCSGVEIKHRMFGPELNWTFCDLPRLFLVGQFIFLTDYTQTRLKIEDFHVAIYFWSASKYCQSMFYSKQMFGHWTIEINNFSGVDSGHIKKAVQAKVHLFRLKRPMYDWNNNFSIAHWSNSTLDNESTLHECLGKQLWDSIPDML